MIQLMMIRLPQNSRKIGFDLGKWRHYFDRLIGVMRQKGLLGLPRGFGKTRRVQIQKKKHFQRQKTHSSQKHSRQKNLNYFQKKCLS